VDCVDDAPGSISLYELMRRPPGLRLFQLSASAGRAAAGDSCTFNQRLYADVAEHPIKAIGRVRALSAQTADHCQRAVCHHGKALIEQDMMLVL
jgi:hypothetical protein